MDLSEKAGEAFEDFIERIREAEKNAGLLRKEECEPKSLLEDSESPVLENDSLGIEAPEQHISEQSATEPDLVTGPLDPMPHLEEPVEEPVHGERPQEVDGDLTGPAQKDSVPDSPTEPPVGARDELAVSLDVSSVTDQESSTTAEPPPEPAPSDAALNEGKRQKLPNYDRIAIFRKK